MTLTNIVDFTAWTGAYGCSLYGSSKVVGSVARTGWQAIRSVVDGDFTFKSVKWLDNAKEFGEGAGWCMIGLLARQVIARLVSSNPPAAVVTGLAWLGFQHVPSPLVAKVTEFVSRNFFAIRMM